MRNIHGKEFAELREALTGKRTYTTPCTITSVEKRDNGVMNVTGYAAVFDAPSKPICGIFLEYIKRGAFRKALSDPNLDVPLLINHSGVPFARTTNNTLRLSEDARGLHFDADIVSTNDGQDLYKRVQTGLLTKMSFAFVVGLDEWQYADDETGELDVRYVWEFSEICDVSIVNDPAYDDTDVAGADWEAERIRNNSVTTPTSSATTFVSLDVSQESPLGNEQQKELSGETGGSGDTDANLIRGWHTKSLVRSHHYEPCIERTA